MGIMAEVRRGNVKDGNKVRLDQMKIEFKYRKRVKSSITKDQLLEASKNKWKTAVGYKPPDINVTAPQQEQRPPQKVSRLQQYAQQKALYLQQGIEPPTRTLQEAIAQRNADIAAHKQKQAEARVTRPGRRNSNKPNSK